METSYHKAPPTEDAFYKQLFIENKHWSSKYPNRDEATRAGKILPLVSQIANMHYSTNTYPLQIADVGCGRGWLSHLMSTYGEVTGIEPVKSIVNYAKILYPNISFVTSTPREFITQLLEDGTEKRFDLVICSEVIEHVPREQQSQFLLDLATLLGEQGDIILTTPRGELFEAWTESNYAKTAQPIENWLSEHDLDALAVNLGLKIYQRDRCHPVSLPHHFPEWVFKRPFRLIFERFGYLDGRPWARMIYQVVWLKKG